MTKKADTAAATGKEAPKTGKKAEEKPKVAKKGTGTDSPKPAAPKKEKAPKAAVEPDWVEQLNEKGEIEVVDKNKFPYEVVCSECGSIRYVGKSGLGQVTMCKLHAKRARRKRSVKARVAKMKNYKAIVDDAVANKLFPKAFKEKHGLA